MASRNLAAGSFDSLDPPLTPWIADMVASMGFHQMTPVQASVIPVFIKNKDVVVEAVTGSGKTLSFVIPILERLVRRDAPLGKHEVGAIIISPTRELATQIHSVVSSFIDAQPSSSSEISSPDSTSLRTLRSPLLLIGGGGGGTTRPDASNAVSKFRSEGADIVIGTPGRMEEFLLGKSSMPGKAKKGGADGTVAKATVKGLVNLKSLEVLVLDEADRLLDLGFSPVLTSLLSALPKQRRTGLFSATMSSALASLVRVGLRNPVKVVVKTSVAPSASLVTGQGKGKGKAVEEEASAPEGLESGYVVVQEGTKVAWLKSVLDTETASGGPSPARKVIVFLATGAEVDHWYKVLTRHPDFSAYSFHSLHGSLPPARRQATYSSFTSSLPSTSPSILLTTDVAARGIDVPEVDVVVQMEPPGDPRGFAHRIGRTARAGRSGKAVALLRQGKEQDYVGFMRIRKMPLERLTYPLIDVEEVARGIRKVILSDRALHESAVKAFVSNVRSYSKHEASYIFRVRDLDLPAMAKGMGVLRLPKMPELKGGEVPEGGWLDPSVDWDSYAYADKTREQQRLQALATTPKRPLADDATAAANARAAKRQKTRNSTAWSDKLEKKEEKELRKERRDQKKKALKASEGVDGKEAGDSEDEEEEKEDWKELVKEKRGNRRRDASPRPNGTVDFAGLT